MNYAIFDKISNGTTPIKQYGRCPKPSFERMLAQGKGVIEIPDGVTDLTHEIGVVNGKYVPVEKAATKKTAHAKADQDEKDSKPHPDRIHIKGKTLRLLLAALAKRGIDIDPKELE